MAVPVVGTCLLAAAVPQSSEGLLRDQVLVYCVMWGFPLKHRALQKQRWLDPYGRLQSQCNLAIPTHDCPMTSRPFIALTLT